MKEDIPHNSVEALSWWI